MHLLPYWSKEARPSLIEGGRVANRGERPSLGKRCNAILNLKGMRHMKPDAVFSESCCRRRNRCDCLRNWKFFVKRRFINHTFMSLAHVVFQSRGVASMVNPSPHCSLANVRSRCPIHEGDNSIPSSDMLTPSITAADPYVRCKTP